MQCGETLQGSHQVRQHDLVYFCLWWFAFHFASRISFAMCRVYQLVCRFIQLFWVLACRVIQVDRWFEHQQCWKEISKGKCGVGLLHRHRLALVLLCFIHRGEAHNPGPIQSQPPVWTLGTFNPSGLNGKQQVLTEFLSYGDLWAVTETHLSSRAMHSFKGGLKSSKSPFSYCVGGHPAPPRPLSEHVGAWTGVAMVSKHPTRPLPIVWKKDTYQTARAQVTATLCHDLWITGGVVYGEPPGLSHPFAKEHTEILLREVIDAVLGVKGLRFVAGDWNFQLGQLEAFQQLRQHGFQDLQTIAQEKWGRTPRPTCKGVTRKDFFFISPELRDLLIDVKTVDDIWADHSVLAGVFQGGPKQVRRYSWRIPTTFPWPKDFAKSSFCPQVDFAESDPSKDYEELWKQTEEAASLPKVTTNTQKTSEPTNQQKEQNAHSSAYGRGKTLETVVKCGSNGVGLLKKGRSGDVIPMYHGQSVQHAYWFRQLRRLQAYSRHRKVHPYDDSNAHGTQLWRSILCAKGFGHSFRKWWYEQCQTLIDGAPTEIPLVAPTWECAEAIYHTFAIEVRKLENSLNKARRSRAIQKREEIATLIFQDIKKVSPDRVDLLLSNSKAQVVEICPENVCITLSEAIPLAIDQPCVIDGKSFDIIHAEQEWVYLESIEGININSSITQHRFVGTLEEMFQEFETEWSKRWNRHQNVEHSQWDQIIEFAKLKLRYPTFHLQDITPSMLRKEIARKKLRSSSGLDGVSLSDLKQMPEAVIQEFCNIFARAEATGDWPCQLVTGKVASLAKTDAPSKVQEFRPITIFSQLYRLWGSIRAKQILQAIDVKCPAWLLGNRPGCHAMQLWMQVQWMIEVAHTTGCHLSGVSADIQKAFNHLPREVVMAAGLCVGIPSPILCGWAGALRSLSRRFQIRDSLGPPIYSVTGCPEGCSMSCVAMLLIDMMFHHWVESQCPSSVPLSYVDDWQVLTNKVEQTSDILQSLEEFTSRVDLLLDKQKTFAWSTDSHGRKNLKKLKIPAKHQARSLGAQMQYTRAHGAKVIRDRIQDLQQLWPKLKSSLSPYFMKVRVLSRAAWPKGLHGISATHLGPSAYKTLRAGAMRGIEAEGSGCSSWIHLGMIEKPEADPQFWALKETLRCIRLCQNESQIGMLLDLAIHNDTSLPSGGPTKALVNRLQYIGWNFCSGPMIRDQWGEFSLFAISFQELMIRATVSWQFVIAAKMSERTCFAGLAQADPISTRKFLEMLPLTEQGLYRKALNGAAFTNDILCHFSESGSDLCKFCGAKDSRKHRFWVCPAFTAERSHLPAGFVELIDELPACLTEAGWALRSETHDEWWSYLQSLEHGPPRPLQASWMDSQGWVDLFTDGSCLLPTREEVRFASWSVCRANPDLALHDSEVVAAGVLPGILQSAFRAELYAVWQAISWAVQSGCKIRLWTDCQGVVTKLQRLLAGSWKPQSNSNHADLWEQIMDRVNTLTPDACRITKVAAHQSVLLSDSPLETWAYLHNTLADRAACLANLSRPETFWKLHQKHLAAVDQVQEVNRVVQGIILAISRRALVRDSVEQSEEPQEGDVPNIISKPEQVQSEADWTQPVLTCQAPIQVSQKFGHRLTALVGAWLTEGFQQAEELAMQPSWISWYQLYIDYQIRTGDHGPYFDGGWQDPAIRVMLKARPFKFRKRCAWFVKLVKQLLGYNDVRLRQQVIRPNSVIFALHTASVGCAWSDERLQAVEQWVTARLPRSATRDGKILDSLPVAKHTAEQSCLSITPGPLGY